MLPHSHCLTSWCGPQWVNTHSRKLRLALNSWSSCLHLPSIGITGMHHHTYYAIVGIKPRAVWGRQTLSQLSHIQDLKDKFWHIFPVFWPGRERGPVLGEPSPDSGLPQPSLSLSPFGRCYPCAHTTGHMACGGEGPTSLYYRKDIDLTHCPTRSSVAPFPTSWGPWANTQTYDTPTSQKRKLSTLTPSLT